MDDEFLALRFEEHRTHLRAVAHRMLGSLSEADDAVQEAWLRLGRAGAGGVDNLGGWLTTVVGRVCLDMLRSRRSRREDPLDARLPDPIVVGPEGTDPEQQALLADSVGLALLVVLETLPPAERLAFVLHDLFAVPFDEIAPVLDRSPAAARQLASRARRRVRGVTPRPEADLSRQREVVDAFLSAARNGDFEALVAVLDPDVVLRADHGGTGPAEAKAGTGTGTGTAGGFRLVRGAAAVARGAATFSQAARFARPVLVNGAPGLLTAPQGEPFSVMGFTVRDGLIVGIDVLADPERLRRLDLSMVLDG
ncbi:RNA polymerase sigma factor SigJ [Kitasatospora herbaricolor]|uniref:RNA polymerase sigma factor SigJ n=1 Tax=Kitasatospora herbaricolor TaxID=68217 RepID=A0ABZ1WF19_9ACTN|nr:RNA polymerase sigma factor SigJ [Kitasatospora herbaricolor]